MDFETKIKGNFNREEAVVFTVKIDVRTLAGRPIHSAEGRHELVGLFAPHNLASAKKEFFESWKTFVEVPLLANLHAHQRLVWEEAEEKKLVDYPAQIDLMDGVKSIVEDSRFDEAAFEAFTLERARALRDTHPL